METCQKGETMSIWSSMVWMGVEKQRAVLVEWDSVKEFANNQEDEAREHSEISLAENENIEEWFGVMKMNNGLGN